MSARSLPVFYVCALCFLISPHLNAKEPPPLWERSAWRAALHYEPLWGGWRSEVSDVSFFLSARGRVDPQGEWRRSAELLDQALAEPQAPSRWAPLCAFPDRFVVLAELLTPSLDLTPRLVERCPGLQEWRDLAARGVAWTIAGPTFAHPASALGHASLWLKAEREVERALSFGAHLASPLDALGALVGWAEGAWTLEPYEGFERRYRVIEERDVAHLPISLSPKARARLGLHLKSVEGASLPYSFFGDNCATQALKLIEVARALAGEGGREGEGEGGPEREPDHPLIVRPKALPSLSPLTLWSEATLSPSRPYELSALFEELSAQERARVEALFEGGDTSRLLERLERLERLDDSNRAERARALPKTQAGWRLALMWLEVREPSLNAPPPLHIEGEPPPLAWRVRQALLLRLADAEPSPLTRPPPQGVAQLLRDPPMLSPELSLSPLAETGALTLRFWRDPLTEPLMGGGEALIAQGPQVWVSAPLSPISTQALRDQLRGGVEWMSLWSLRALNAPQPHASWRLSMGSWSHTPDTSERAPFWVEGGVGGALHLNALNARVWAHVGGRAELSSELSADALFTPLAQLGARGSLGSLKRGLGGRLGWLFIADAHLLSLLSAPTLERSASLQLSLALTARVRLTLSVELKRVRRGTSAQREQQEGQPQENVVRVGLTWR